MSNVHKQNGAEALAGRHGDLQSPVSAEQPGPGEE